MLPLKLDKAATRSGRALSPCWSQWLSTSGGPLVHAADRVEGSEWLRGGRVSVDARGRGSFTAHATRVRSLADRWL